MCGPEDPLFTSCRPFATISFHCKAVHKVCKSSFPTKVLLIVRSQACKSPAHRSQACKSPAHRSQAYKSLTPFTSLQMTSTPFTSIPLRGIHVVDFRVKRNWLKSLHCSILLTTCKPCRRLKVLVPGHDGKRGVRDKSRENDFSALTEYKCHREQHQFVLGMSFNNLKLTAVFPELRANKAFLNRYHNLIAVWFIKSLTSEAVQNALDNRPPSWAIMNPPGRGGGGHSKFKCQEGV